MSKIVKVAALSLFAFSANNALAATDSFNATLEVKQAVTVTNSTDLDFGIITTDSGTDIVIAQADSGAATFAITGSTGSQVSVAISNTDLVNGANKIAAEFDFNPTLTLTAGTAELKVGGTARVASATLAPGTYSATVPVEVTYQ